MIQYPQQSVQQKTEYDSLSILSYFLKDLGVLRNVTTNDFGIDLELDFISKSFLPGRIIKAQVKASRELKLDVSGLPCISGIKQSTLGYWMGISFSCPVIVFAVDVKSEAIYFSEPIHKQAASLIDGTESTKSVQLKYCAKSSNKEQNTYRRMLEKIVFDQPGHELEIAKIMKALKEKGEQRQSYDRLCLAYLEQLSQDSNLREEINLHTRCLERIECIFKLQDRFFNKDPGMEFDDPKFFRFFLRAAKILIGYWPIFDYCKKNGLNIAKIYDEAYWEQCSNEILKPAGYSAGVTYESIRKHIPFLADLLLDYLAARRSAMTSSEAYYWMLENPDYLEEVYDTNIVLDKVGGNHKVDQPKPTTYYALLEKIKVEVKKRQDDYQEKMGKKRNPRSKQQINDGALN